MNTKEKIIATINTHLPELKAKYKVRKIGLFGSIARGEETEKSDIDILVEFSSPIGFFEFIRLENFLSTILKRPVDLISAKAVKPAIQKEVLKDLLYV